MADPVDGSPVLPDFAGACTTNVIDTIVENPDDPPEWFPEGLEGAEQIVLWVLDGLGWNQMVDRLTGLRGLPAMKGRPITTVAPSTTSTALTSISTGKPPGEHGVIGYRLDVDGDVLNILRWTTSKGDAREAIPPETIQHEPVFGGQRPPVVVRAEFRDSGFTRAHLGGCRHVPYRMNSTLIAEVLHQINSNEPFVYAYYDGIDKVAHEYGLGTVYDAEILLVDRMVEYMMEMLPNDVALVITADHGQVDVGSNVFPPSPEVLSFTERQSGEARFRWLHAFPGAQHDLLEAAKAHHSDVAWVVSRDQAVDEGWFGPKVLPSPLSHLGDVALVTKTPVAFEDPMDTGPFILKGRHGALTADEMYVPLLVGRK
ncbi:MAG: alkaline phosphatase family protein [Microthrixaceae bacterium]|nr:alkaline phosphatase family protein [Microthrixaceae bacterium]